MKNKPIMALTVVLLVLFGTLSCHAGDHEGSSNQGGSMFNQQKLRLEVFLRNQNLERFVGHSVEEFISALPTEYEEYYPIDEPPGKLIGFSLRLSDHYVIDIYCFDLKHVEKFDEKRSWNFELFKKEAISKLVVSN